MGPEWVDRCAGLNASFMSAAREIITAGRSTSRDKLEAVRVLHQQDKLMQHLFTEAVLGLGGYQ